MIFYIGAQGGLKTLAKWPNDPGVFSIYRPIDRGYLHLPKADGRPHKEALAVQVPVGDVERRSLDVYDLVAAGGVR